MATAPKAPPPPPAKRTPTPPPMPVVAAPAPIAAVAAPVAAPVAVTPAPVEPSAEDEADEWEWQMAMARARAQAPDEESTAVRADYEVLVSSESMYSAITVVGLPAMPANDEIEAAAPAEPIALPPPPVVGTPSTIIPVPAVTSTRDVAPKTSSAMDPVVRRAMTPIVPVVESRRMARGTMPLDPQTARAVLAAPLPRVTQRRASSSGL